MLHPFVLLYLFIYLDMSLCCLEILNDFEQEALHLHFVLSSTNLCPLSHLRKSLGAHKHQHQLGGECESARLSLLIWTPWTFSFLLMICLSFYAISSLTAEFIEPLSWVGHCVNKKALNLHNDIMNRIIMGYYYPQQVEAQKLHNL